ncbi:MAG: hypothetical protein M1819_002431 [Sarea resinae]|nr:MAG: hypothetical protein M1819_002431 [Sarea resinae]
MADVASPSPIPRSAVEDDIEEVDQLAAPSPKRQRLDAEYDHRSSRYSSPDELGATPNPGSVPSQSPKWGSDGSSHEHDDSRDDEADGNGDGADSPDELDHTVHAFYRDDRTRSPQRSRHTSVEADPAITPSGAPTPAPPEPAKVAYRQKLILRGHKKGVSAVKFSPDGRWIASCSADATIKVWDATTGRHLRTLEGHLAGISTIAWSPDSKTLASGSDDKSIRLWDVSTGKAYPVPLLGHHNYVYSLAFSPKGNMLVSGSYDEAVFLWDVRTARVMRSLPAHSDPVGGVDFTRDGTLVVSCAGDGLIRVWDTATGQCLRTLVHEDNAPVVSVRFSPNGKYVLAWTLDSCVRLWNYVDGRCVKTYQGHKNERYSMSGAFGVYGAHAFVVSGSEDGSLVLWDVTKKNVLQQLHGHEDVVLGVDTLPAAKVMASCGLDRTIRIWRDESGDVDEDMEN